MDCWPPDQIWKCLLGLRVGKIGSSDKYVSSFLGSADLLVFLKNFGSIFIRDTDLNFCFFFGLFWYRDNLPSYKSGSVLFLQFYRRIWEELELILPLIFGRTHQWNHLIMHFSSLGGFDDWFDLLTHYWPVPIFYVFMIQIWYIVCFQEIIHFF